MTHANEAIMLLSMTAWKIRYWWSAEGSSGSTVTVTMLASDVETEEPMEAAPANSHTPPTMDAVTSERAPLPTLVLWGKKGRRKETE